MSVSQSKQRRHVLVRNANRAKSELPTWTTNGSFRIRVEALQVGHLVNRSRMCELRTKEYRGDSAPSRCGAWIAEVPDLAGVLTYGATRDEAVAHIQALALRVIADRLEHNEAPADLLTVTFRAA
jgi:predicted RNase H-like HicB family nuclease